VVVHSERAGSAICYDIDTPLMLHSVHIGRTVFHISLAVRYHQAHLIALLVTEDLAMDYISLLVSFSAKLVPFS
jgi:hypothetical protein